MGFFFDKGRGEKKKKKKSKGNHSNISLEEFDVPHLVPLVPVLPFWKKEKKKNVMW